MDLPNPLAQDESIDGKHESEVADEPPPHQPAPSTDGRSLRRERNRDAVIDALLELIREGNDAPGTKEIATRAGVSHRSVFRYFEDLDDLVRAAIDHEIAEVLPMAIMPNVGEGPVEHRVDILVDTLLRIFDYTYPVARVARARALAIASIDDTLTSIAHLHRTRLAEQFAPELSALDSPHDQDLLDAIQVMVSFESYDIQQRRLGRSRDDIGRSWRSSLTALLHR